MNAEERDRKRLIGAARDLLLDGDSWLGTLVGDLFARPALEDLAVYTPAEIAWFTRAAASLLGKRAVGQANVRLSDPPADGAAANVTLVEIVNDNMPFLVDSILGELQDFG